MTNVFIDGSAGTTGLKIFDLLAKRPDISLIRLPEELRKDPAARADAINSADIVFLCLPDAAAREAVSFIRNKNTAVIDTSTAHRTSDDWEYGFAELSCRRERIAASKRIANPGCHASGFLALTEPLVREGIIKPDAALTCFSLTGYSGGGKKMIAEYEDKNRSIELSAPRQYGLAQTHKHLPEMQKIAGLSISPAFCPIVADYFCGMQVTVPLFAKDVKGNIEDIKAIYAEKYNSKIVHFENSEAGLIAANAYAGRDDMAVSVYGNEDRILLVSTFDNLGKGASGAAIQNMNILLGIDETTGLIV
ncbi:MAG: N-acetyl-gamma-glutamyl-phosphate reductase [Ruminococcaceae bacterium]|nr:N-acetyl-gamma-glutamyl-phosphate reductase [Oscillospiraceae bacterium]